MKETVGTNPSRLIALLNSLHWGDLDGIHARLREAHACCLELEQQELADKLDEAATALRSADVKTYRRNVETVVSRLGHLR